MKITISEPIPITPFDSPNDFPNFNKKEFSEDEMYSFARRMMAVARVEIIYGTKMKYIGDEMKQWKENQKNGIWE